MIAKAQALHKGDTIGLVAPASRPLTERVTAAVRYFESLGYRIKLGKHIDDQFGYLAGTDTDRTADLHTMFSDRTVKAIFFLRGGYGTLRMLPLIDYDLIRRNPKIIVGYSDATALFHSLYKLSGLRSCFFGPMPAVDIWNGFDPFAEECLWKMLTSADERIELPANDDEVIPLNPHHHDGISAQWFGGNLAVLASLMGTPYLPSLKNRILMLEDVSEPPYRIDRLLAQFEAAGILGSSRAVLLGQFTDCTEPDLTKPTFSTDEVLRQYFARRDFPVLMNVPFGHIRRQWTLPLGAYLQISKRRVTLIRSPLNN